MLNVLLNVIIFHQELPVAINGPRINTHHPHSSFDNHTDAPAQLDIESRIAVAVQDALRARGNVQRVLKPYGMNSGGGAVGVNPQTPPCAAAPICAASAISSAGNAGRW